MGLDKRAANTGQVHIYFIAMICFNQFISSVLLIHEINLSKIQGYSCCTPDARFVQIRLNSGAQIKQES